MELFSLTPNEVGLNAKRKRVIVELQKLFARLQSPDFIGSYCSSFALSTKSLTNSFGWKADQVMDQHDINELYNLLLDGIEDQMPLNKKILNKYYKGRIINVIKCTQCDYESQRKEDFVQLNVILRRMNSSFDSLHESLLSMYIDNEEILENENAYFCPQCNEKVRAKKFCRLIKLPSIMVCNLNRFYYDLKSGERVKINKKFSFPKSLDLSMFIQNEYTQITNNDIKQYDLIGCVVHRGSGANAGHYHAFIRDMNHEVDWKPIKRKKKNKKKRRQPRKKRNNTDKDTRKREKSEQATAILVTILSEHESLTRNRLANEFNRITNLTGWNHSYSDVLGTFTNFLKNNHRFRIINASNRVFSVCLASDINNNGDLNGFVVPDNDCDAQDEEYTPNEISKSSDKSPPSNDEEVEEVKYDANAAHWFDFNDEDITAVFDSEINHLYDGGDEECPYMVIYRRKCMNTGNWPPEIPPFVSSLLIDEPLDAEEDKQQIAIGILKLSKNGDEPKKKKRKTSDKSSSSSLAKLPDPNRNKKRSKRKKKKTIEYVSSEYLEPIEMMKGNTLCELYTAVSEWSAIDLKYLFIAQILCKGRKYAKNPIVLNLSSKDDSLKLKRVPINNLDNILVWDSSKYGDDLAQKELIRRKECIALSVYIFSRDYPLSVYINTSRDTLNDLYLIIYCQLNAEEKNSICECGRFRDVDTHLIYREMKSKTLSELGINDGSILKFESKSIPSANEFVIRYRLKTKDISAKDSEEKELYICRQEFVSTLFVMMTSSFGVDSDKFDLRKGRSDWAVSTWIDSDSENKLRIKNCRFDETQRLILSQNNVNKNGRNLDILCETFIDDDGIKRFKIPKHLLSQNDDDDDDVLMEEKEKETQIESDGLDIYECNSSIFCRLNIDKSLNGFSIKKEIIKQKQFNLNTFLSSQISPLNLRISILTKTGSRTKWHILNGHKVIGGCTGKCIVEFLDSPQKDNDFGNKASGKALIFVHKYNYGAVYGSRYQVSVTQNQREKLSALKMHIISQCDFNQNIKSKDIILATRNILNHRWSILTEKEIKSKNNNKTKMIMKPKIYDRDIVAVLNTKSIDINKENIHPHIFQTKFDKYFAKKYEKEIKIHFTDDDDEDEPELKINFINDEQCQQQLN